MREATLVINAGSSSIKFAVYLTSDNGALSLEAKGQVEGLGSDPKFEVKGADGAVIDEHDEWERGSTFNHSQGIAFILRWVRDFWPDVVLTAAGHRVVHGGVAFDRAVKVDPGVIDTVTGLTSLAPLHQPHNLAGIRAVAEADPGLPQVACFDTAFHRTQPLVAQTFALPRTLTDSGVRRYGFHGLSYEYIARTLPEYAPEAKKAVVAHLGSGASMCAIKDGKSVESSMGFTAVDGLPMGTRTGALDPGVVLYLMQDRGYDAAQIEKLLYKDSGLLGMSGVSNDMRDLDASDDPNAKHAIDVFIYSIAKFVGSLSAVLGGTDALVFTAGIGENAPKIREAVCRRSEWLGVKLDEAANKRGGPRISTEDSPVSAWVIPTDEERMIALHTVQILANQTR
jgi:acetate kinase